MYRSTVLYARVSSSKQDTLSQWPQLRSWAKKENILYDEIEDVGTGKNMNRDGMRRIVHGIKSGWVKRVVVCSLNRLGRNAGQVWEFIDLAMKHDVQVITLREHLDFAHPMGRAMAQIVAVLAELENEQRSEATRAGLAASKERAEREGRKWKANGNVKGYSLKVTRTKYEIMKMLRSQGKSYAAIGREVGLSDNTVRKELLHPRAEYLTRGELASKRKNDNGGK